MHKDNTPDPKYKYIIIDHSDPNLMWNCALSIIVFIILLMFLIRNWKPKCSGSVFEELSGLVDSDTIRSSLSGFSNKRIL
jgi:hypothetical protein